jgi:hypothetical protein
MRATGGVTRLWCGLWLAQGGLDRRLAKSFTDVTFAGCSGNGDFGGVLGEGLRVGG